MQTAHLSPRELLDANRHYYDSLWSGARLVEPDRFNTWPLIQSLLPRCASRLEVAPGLTLLDSGKLPPEWQPIATAHARALEVLRDSPVNWTSISPAAYFDPGERTGRFRLGTDDLIVDSRGDSRISMEDYAIALVDELEDPRHARGRFSVGY